MSWSNCKSFSPKGRLIKKNLEITLKRCSRFLTRLSFKNLFLEYTEYKNPSIINIIANECPNLQAIDLGEFFVTKKSIELLKPNFNKVHTFRCKITDVDDEDLVNIFLQNKILQHLKINATQNSKSLRNFWKALPSDTLTHLQFVAKDPYLDTQAEEHYDINFIHRFTSLKSLFLNHCMLTVEASEMMASNCLELKCVKFFCKFLAIFNSFKHSKGIINQGRLQQKFSGGGTR